MTETGKTRPEEPSRGGVAGRLRERGAALVMRLTLSLIVFLFVAYGRETVVCAPGVLIGLVLGFVFLSFVQLITPDRIFHAQPFQAAGFLAEVGLLSFAIYATQGFNSDLYLAYFLTIMMAGLARQVWQLVLVSIVSCVFYGALLTLSHEGARLLEPALLMRVPFLMLVSVFVALYAQAVRSKTVQLERVGRELDEALHQLSLNERLSVIGQVVGGVTGEIQNPLMGILNFSRLLLTKEALKADPSLRESAAYIEKAADRCLRIVKNMSAFAKPHAPKKTAVDVNAVLEKCLADRAGAARWDRALQPGAPPVPADAEQVKSVFDQILDNALEALAAGPRGTGEITVRTRAAEGRVRVEITDNGPGIAPENLMRVFDPFFSTKDPSTHPGLGLSLAYGVVKEHGGTLWAESKPNVGARFVVELPTGPVAEPAAPAAAASPHRILVIDDEPIILEVMSRALSGQGHTVEVAKEGVTAKQRLSDNAYDAVFCDVRLPGMNGIELYNWMVGARAAGVAGWVFVTGSVSAGTAAYLESTGRPVLFKPFTLKSIQDALQRALRAA